MDEEAQSSRPPSHLTCKPLISGRRSRVTARVVVCEKYTRGLIEHRDAQHVRGRGAARGPTASTDQGSTDRAEAGVYGRDPELLLPPRGEGAQATYDVLGTRHARGKSAGLHEGMELEGRDQSLSLAGALSSPRAPPPHVSLSGYLNVLHASEERLSASNAIRGVEHARERPDGLFEIHGRLQRHESCHAQTRSSLARSRPWLRCPSDTARCAAGTLTRGPRKALHMVVGWATSHPSLDPTRTTGG